MYRTRWLIHIYKYKARVLFPCDRLVWKINLTKALTTIGIKLGQNVALQLSVTMAKHLNLVTLTHIRVYIKG